LKECWIDNKSYQGFPNDVQIELWKLIQKCLSVSTEFYPAFEDTRQKFFGVRRTQDKLASVFFENGIDVSSLREELLPKMEGKIKGNSAIGIYTKDEFYVAGGVDLLYSCTCIYGEDSTVETRHLTKAKEVADKMRQKGYSVIVLATKARKSTDPTLDDPPIIPEKLTLLGCFAIANTLSAEIPEFIKAVKQNLNIILHVYTDEDMTFGVQFENLINMGGGPINASKVTDMWTLMDHLVWCETDANVLLDFFTNYHSDAINFFVEGDEIFLPLAGLSANCFIVSMKSEFGARVALQILDAKLTTLLRAVLVQHCEVRQVANCLLQ